MPHGSLDREGCGGDTSGDIHTAPYTDSKQSKSNSSNFQTVATNNAGPSRIISSAKPSNKASTYQPNPKSYTTPIIGIGDCSKCGELGHRSNECTAQMSANLIKEYVEDDKKRDGYDEEDIKVVEDVGDPVNSCMQRHHEKEKSPNQHNISRANGSMFGKVCKLTIDDGDCYNINSKILDRHLDLEIETQPKLYIMEVDKSYEGIVRWPMSAHEFYWHQLDSRNLEVGAFTETIMTHGEIKVKWPDQINQLLNGLNLIWVEDAAPQVPCAAENRACRHKYRRTYIASGVPECAAQRRQLRLCLLKAKQK
nr:zf-CCHC domain-containing protein [Ipomoea batatas]